MHLNSLGWMLGTGVLLILKEEQHKKSTDKYYCDGKCRPDVTRCCPWGVYPGSKEERTFQSEHTEQVQSCTSINQECALKFKYILLFSFAQWVSIILKIYCDSQTWVDDGYSALTTEHRTAELWNRSSSPWCLCWLGSHLPAHGAYSCLSIWLSKCLLNLLSYLLPHSPQAVGSRHLLLSVQKTLPFL